MSGPDAPPPAAGAPPAPPHTWSVHCDGSAWPNPGRMGLGAVMVDPLGHRHTLSTACPGTGCNNEAELRALMAALRRVRGLGATRLIVHSDNQVLVAQLAMPSPRPILRLASLFDEARGLLCSFDQFQLRWIPRHRNGEADALARAAIGLPDKPSPFPKPRRKR